MTDEVSVQHLLRERVAEEVRALLARKMMTGAELAAAIGRSPMYVSRRVRGEVAFDLDDIERLVQVLDVDLFTLLPAPARATPAGDTGSRVLNGPWRSVGRPERRRPRPDLPASPMVPQRVDPARPMSAVPARRRRPMPVRPGERRIAR